MIVVYLLRWTIHLAALWTDALLIYFIVRLSVRVATKLALIACFPCFLYVRFSISAFSLQNFPRVVPHDPLSFFAFVVYLPPFFATISTRLIDRSLYDLHSMPIAKKCNGRILFITKIRTCSSNESFVKEIYISQIQIFTGKSK